MRRTVLSATALACTAVLASVVPAFADDQTPSPAPTTRPDGAETPAATPSPAPSEEGATPSPAPSEEGTPSPAPSEEGAPSEAPVVPEGAEPSQVPVVPEGAPDTGVAPESGHSGAGGELIGGGAVAALGLGGAAVFLVRRRRATGA